MSEAVKGSKELVKALKQLENKVGNKILRTECRAGAKELATDIKAAAPVGKTGKLTRAVKVRSGKRKKGQISFVATIDKATTPDVYYGPFVEFGTHKQHAQHFEETTAEQKGKGVLDATTERIAKAIEQAAKESK